MADDDVREIKESPWTQGEGEERTYTVTTTPWGSSPSAPSMVVKDLSAADPTADVSATVAPTGTVTASGDVITLKEIKSLTAGHKYRVEVLFTTGGNIEEAWGIIKAEV